MNEKDRRTEESIADRLTKLIRVGWVIAAGAFAIGGWVVRLDFRDRDVHEKIDKQEMGISLIHSEIEKITSEIITVDKSLSEVKSNTYTLREAQVITERLIVLETQSRAQTERLNEALLDLKAILQRQAAL